MPFWDEFELAVELMSNKSTMPLLSFASRPCMTCVYAWNFAGPFISCRAQHPILKQPGSAAQQRRVARRRTCVLRLES